jgi:acetyltransferase
MFNASSVAVVGATDDTSKLRGKILGLLRDGGFEGAVYPVNPGRETVQGLRAYPDIPSLPEAVDLALIAIPGEQVPQVVGQASARGVGGAVIFSSGVDAAALAAAAGGVRLLGPNTEGFFRPGSRLAATFAPVVEHVLAEGPRGAARGRRVSIVSQSGGLGFALYGHGLHEHLDFHSVITTGNEVDLECLDAVDFLLEEGEAEVILLFIEGLKHACRLAEVAEKAAERNTPLVVMKVGRSEAGQRAAVSHTAHLTGADTAYDAVFDRYGVIRVFDQEAMLAAAAALSRLPRRGGRRAAVVTTSGGAGAWAADLCGMQGVEAPLLSDALQADIAALIPAFGSPANPVDVTAQITEDGGQALVQVLDRLEASEEIDAVIVNMGLSKAGRIKGLAPVLGPMLQVMTKPILFHSHIRPEAENVSTLVELGGQVFPSFRACALALDVLDRDAAFRRRWRERETPAPVRPGRLQPVAAGVLDEAATRALLDAYGVPAPPSALAQDLAGARAAAEAMGFPVALKIQSPDIPHKTEAGGVALGVTAEEFGAAFQRIMSNSRSAAPDARIEGVLVQKMARPGHEMVVGVVVDPDFGPLVMLGAGGIYVEVLKDVAFTPAPLGRVEAMRLIEGLKSYAILKGARGKPAADIEALADLVVRVGDLAAAEAAVLDQIDLNPVFVYPRGEGVVAVDSLVAVKATDVEARH